MTKFRSGRGRTLAAMLAAVMLSSVLALVAAVTAGAQVSEGGLEDDGSRRLAGADRFETAIKVAQNYVGVPGGSSVGSSTDLILVSGRSLVDAIPAVSIAASRRAPVILTESADRGDLHPQVQTYIEENNIQNVYIVGRERAVSFNTRRDLNNIASTTKVADDLIEVNDPFRFGGENRYETATIVARQVAELGTYCGNPEPAVFMVNGEGQPGDDEFLLDGVIVAPFAYALGMPVLLTSVGGLPPEVATYLSEAGVGRVVIVGGEGEVGPNVVEAMEGLGVQVDRISVKFGYQAGQPGAEAVNSPDRAGALYQVMSQSCPGVELVPNTWALLDLGEPIDGVTAAATLATGMGVIGNEDKVVPVLALNADGLLSDDDPAKANEPENECRGMPASMQAVLTNADRSNRSGNIFALGGTSRVWPCWVEAAVGAVNYRLDN